MNAVTSPSVRGPLKFAVETSSPGLEAGKRFSVSLRISNPYDVSVTVDRVETKLPAKFVAASTVPRKTLKQRLGEWWENKREEAETRAIAEAATSSRVQGQALDDQGAQGPVLLQPGNSTVQVFPMYATGWLWFSPSTFNLNIEVTYVIDDKPNHDTVSYQMNIRAPLRAIIVGALVGSFIGFVVRDHMKDNQISTTLVGTSQAGSGLALFLALLTSLITAAMVVVAFARKKDAQPILSIEDFYGGLFIGFLSAYGGNALLDQLTGKSTVQPTGSSSPLPR